MADQLLTWTRPSEIEGEPDEVVELSKRQLAELAEVVGDTTLETFKQLRAAGVGDQTLEAWRASPAGRKAEDLAWAAKVFVEAARAVNQ